MKTPRILRYGNTARSPRAREISLAVTGLIVGAVVGVSITSLFEHSSSQPVSSITTLENELNSSKHVASNVIVEVGYQVPVPSNDPDGPITVVNPIKLGKNTYGYITEVSGITGNVVIKEVRDAKPLQPTSQLDKSKELPHEITTSVAEVYSTIVDDPSVPGGRGYAVVPGTHAGDVSKLDNITPGIAASSVNQETYDQFEQIYNVVVGEMLYANAKGN